MSTPDFVVVVEGPTEFRDPDSEAWMLADPKLVQRTLPAGKKPESLWGKKHDSRSNHPSQVLRRCVLEPSRISHNEAVDQFDPSRARPHAPSLDAFMSEVEALAERQFVG